MDPIIPDLSLPLSYFKALNLGAIWVVVVIAQRVQHHVRKQWRDLTPMVCGGLGALGVEPLSPFAHWDTYTIFVRMVLYAAVADVAFRGRKRFLKGEMYEPDETPLCAPIPAPPSIGGGTP